MGGERTFDKSYTGDGYWAESGQQKIAHITLISQNILTGLEYLEKQRTIAIILRD